MGWCLTVWKVEGRCPDERGRPDCGSTAIVTDRALKKSAKERPGSALVLHSSIKLLSESREGATAQSGSDPKDS